MKLSTKGRYGLKAMFELAKRYGEGPIPLKSIADSQDISENYLEQLISVLKKEGIVNSVRGAQGGYFLAYPPKDITVGRILRALEGNLAPTDCVIKDEAFKCDKEDFCVTKTIWIKIRDSINDVIDSVTLQDMVDEHYKMNKNNGYMYYI
ncbi:hypothetical protein TR13x_01470 [Caloranaerobacter sp. TR13]|uniref:RrF2 family transcriptional regulator n=1 Tax=Caloranaerobacter sp. TR13 TaxID=1302151 RepID=UPI0006D41060|nr:Rrf2 family transcriptional regulator [Caloranaerobacter sp. TR13]KPU28042.1 hypothetical protein TR13x_01470 [Caloranaerobacter sp. TR13]